VQQKKGEKGSEREGVRKREGERGREAVQYRYFLILNNF